MTKEQKVMKPQEEKEMQEEVRKFDELSKEHKADVIDLLLERLGLSIVFEKWPDGAHGVRLETRV